MGRVGLGWIVLVSFVCVGLFWFAVFQGAVERAGVVINSAGLLRSEWREAGGMAAQRSVVLTCTAGAAPTCVAPCRW